MSEKVTLRLSTPYGGEDSVFRGDPLNVYVSVHCHGPLEAENHNDSIELDIQELKEKLSRDEIEQEDYEKKLEELESKKIKIDYPTIGSTQQPWYQSIRFYNQETNDPLNWEFVSMFTNHEKPVIQFQTDSSAHTGFMLSPDKLENISPGTYRIVAKIEDLESNSIRISGVIFSALDQLIDKPVLQRFGGRHVFISFGFFSDLFLAHAGMPG